MGTDAYYMLTDNIDLGSDAWIPIGNSMEHMFKGHFDGNGKTVTFNGTIKDQVYDSVQKANDHKYCSIAGLFGLCQKAEIRDLTLAGMFHMEQTEYEKNDDSTQWYSCAIFSLYAGGVSAVVWSEATVAGCYYSDTCSITGESYSSVLDGKAGISATEDEIKNGTVAYYMNQAPGDSAAYCWGQDLSGIRFKNKTEYHVLYLWVVASLRTIGR